MSLSAGPYRDTKGCPPPPPRHDTKIVSQHHCGQDARARCSSPLRAGQVVLRVLLALSQRSTVRPSTQARPCRALARTCALPVEIHSCYIATRAGKWAVAHLVASPARFFFSFIFFFICSTHFKTTIFFFPNLPVEPKKKFIIINLFPVLHTVKLTEKKKISLNIFFLFLQ